MAGAAAASARGVSSRRRLMPVTSKRQGQRVMLQRDRGRRQQAGRKAVGDEGHKGQQGMTYGGENGRGAGAGASKLAKGRRDMSAGSSGRRAKKGARSEVAG